ncbi:MAG: c-type cytochrome biogenesis protein CcmI, partial [Caulobacterales bacterium 32-67-6]
MIVFWIMTGLAAAMAGLLVLTGARRGADVAGADADVGGRELDELDRLKARGLLDEAAHAAARAEAARRLLAGQAVAAAPPVVGRQDRFWVLGGIAATTAGALALYVLTGSPGLPDQAYERRVDQWSTQLETLEPAQ